MTSPGKKPVPTGPGPKARKKYLHVACTNLLTCYFLGDWDLASFKSFIYSDLHGTVVVREPGAQLVGLRGVSAQSRRVFARALLGLGADADGRIPGEC